MELKQRIEKIWEDRSLLRSFGKSGTYSFCVEKLDKGELRVAEPVASGWRFKWIKKAVILYFPIQQMETIEVGPLNFTIK